MVRRTCAVHQFFLCQIFSFQRTSTSARLRPLGLRRAPASSKLNGPSGPLNFILAGGGEYRDRTGDLLRAKQALSQLS
jgi:hypothetical protein